MVNLSDERVVVVVVLSVIIMVALPEAVVGQEAAVGQGLPNTTAVMADFHSNHEKIL